MKRTILFLALFLTLQQNVLAAPAVDMAKVSENYNNAVILHNSKKYDLAILEYKKVLRAVPYEEKVKDALAASYIARASEYNKQKNLRKAVNDLKSAMFYLEYWGDRVADPAKLPAAASTKASIAELSKELGDSTAPAQMLTQAKSLRSQGELAAAGYEFIQLFPNSTYSREALENAGDIYKSLNNEHKAMESYRKILSKDGNDALIHFKYAVILDNIGNVDAAADEYNNALKYADSNPEVLTLLEGLWKSRIAENPKDAQSYINLGAVYQKKGDYSGAKTQYSIAQQLDPSDRTIALNLASLYVSQGNYKNAIDAYNILLDKNPENTEILGYKAYAYIQLKDYRNAIAQYKMILAVDPRNSNAQKMLNESISKLEGPELMSYLEVQANSNPTDYIAQYDYAYELHKNKEYKKAIPYYTRALNINPAKVEGYLNLSQLYSTLDDYASADAVVEQGLLHLPNNPKLTEEKSNLLKAQSGPLYKTASDYWEKGDYKAALENYLKIPYQTPEVLAAIASCYYELGDNSKAVMYYIKTLSKNPNDTESMYLLASAYLNMDDEAKAKEYLEKILTLDPQNKSAKDVLMNIGQNQKAKEFDDAIALFEAKNYTKALEAFNKVTAGDPKNAYAHYYIGAIYDEQKKPANAITQYKKVIELDPKFSLAYYALAANLDAEEKYQDAAVNYDKFVALKTQEGAQEDEYTKYSANRSKELKDYLKSLK